MATKVGNRSLHEDKWTYFLGQDTNNLLWVKARGLERSTRTLPEYNVTWVNTLTCQPRSSRGRNHVEVETGSRVLDQRVGDDITLQSSQRYHLQLSSNELPFLAATSL